MKICSGKEVNGVVRYLWPIVHEQMENEELLVVNAHHRNRLADLAIRVLCGELAEFSGCPESRIHEVVKGELGEPHSTSYYGHLEPNLQDTYTRTVAIAKDLLSQTATLSVPIRVVSQDEGGANVVVVGKPTIEIGDPIDSDIAL